MDGFVHLPRKFIQKVANQQRNIGRAFAQGWQPDRKYVQPVIQIGAKAALFDHLRQIAIGGGDQPDIDFQRVRAADPLEFLILQHPQQLGLSAGAQFAHFVQKQGAAISEFKPALALSSRAGERALFMAE